MVKKRRALICEDFPPSSTLEWRTTLNESLIEGSLIARYSSRPSKADRGASEKKGDR
jgi:hypothetical protein